MKIYKVGGTVRDQILNQAPKDSDLVIEAESYEKMREYVKSHSKKIFLEKPNFGTIRYLNCDGKPEDISLAIKSRSKKPDRFLIGPITEDLINRDFTMNALAQDLISNELIDPLNGKNDIHNKIIKCCKNPNQTFSQDPLRIIRAIRFKIQLGFKLAPSIEAFLKQETSFDMLKEVHPERIRSEVDYCFKIDPIAAIKEFYQMSENFGHILFNYHQLKIDIGLKKHGK